MLPVEWGSVVAYVSLLAKAEGGFGATRRLPATAEDTFHALAIFRVLDQWAHLPGPLAACRENQGLKGYLRQRLNGRQLDAKTVFQLHATARLMALPATATTAIEGLAAGHFHRHPSLHTAYHAALVLGHALLPQLEERLGDEWAARLLPERATSEELMMWLALQQAVGVTPQADRRAELGRWFGDCQGPDGGFGFLPGTTSFMENCHFCLRALALLEARPRDPQGALAFITSCQTVNGGFGRRAKAAPFLDATYHAVSALMLLDKRR
ncbi:MAG: hypothetical protein M0T76_09575 [Desulfobacteraceae bacterium]|nr:hypothetical protein [Desulfobacteraceae bacterium]